MVDYGDYGANSYCMLELARRGSGDTTPSDTESGLFQNRIGLLATNISISTNKQSLAFPVPFSGVISGESTTLALDMGLATKTITITGILKDQTLFKRSKGGTQKEVKLTAYELAQLLHSYVDSSFLHEDQNVSKLIILIPSRADTNFDYRSGVTANTELKDLPLIPFHYGNRTFDMPTLDGTKIDWGATEFPSALTSINEEIPGLSGFINDFSTDIAGDQIPSIAFNLTFTVASTAMSDFINASF
jgi:hypothetical protein|tara:strand:- start:2309 stop:3046 length:738 start_codon:yes stop_codon:yes gene_type:complete